MRGGGGRSFSSRGGAPNDRNYGGKFRDNSYRDRGSSGGRFNNNQSRGNDRRFDDNFNKPGSSMRNRSRYDRRSPDRFSHGNNDRSSRNDGRDDGLSRKRPRHEGNSGSRREFNNNPSNSNRHGRHYANGGSGGGGGGRNNSSSRNNRRPSPAVKSSPRHGNNDKASSHRVKDRPVNKALRKFGGKGAVREKVEANSRVRRSKLVSSVRTNIMRRRLANRNREAARRAKLMRSSLKKRDAKKKTVDGDKAEKTEKPKTNDTEVKLEADNETDKKKTTKKSAENSKESDENVKTEPTDETDGDNVAETDEMPVDKSSDAEDDDESKKKGDDKENRKKFVRLYCMHCRIECASFKDYNNHIHSRGHKLVLGRYGLKQKTRLARMRLAQRNSQRQMEKELKDTEKLTPQFCMLCRLNYRSPKEDHMQSEAHGKMKEFLMPYCETCSMSFKSPMSYEIHRCSVEHLRRKANKGAESDVEETEELQVDLENFLIVDSVGDVNGGDFSFSEENDETPVEKSAEVEKPRTERTESVNVGNEHVKKIEVLYCDLCRYYLPHLEDPDAALQKHCSTRNHLRAYLRYKENQSLKITAELIHRRDHKDKHSKKDSKSVESDGKRSGSVTKTDDETTDKAWEDSEKDVEMEQSNLENNNEDEDDASVERYDRFKNSEKTDEADVSENDADKDLDISKNEATEQNGIESSM